MAQSQFPEGREDRQGAHDTGSHQRRRRRSRMPGAPLDDPDVEAFLLQIARIVLRVKGLAGKPQVRESEEDNDTA